MTEAAGTSFPLLDTSDMLVVHKVFRDALSSAVDLVGGAGTGDTARSGLVGSYYYNVLCFLEGHHSAEDVVVTPRLVERCSPEEAELVEAIAGQHRSVEAPLAATHAAVSTWTTEADPSSTTSLLECLDGLQSVLVPHLDEEEAGVLPLAAAHLTAEEWGELPGHGLRSFSGDNLWLILGLIREGFNDEQRARMLENMPPPVAEGWRQVGDTAFLNFVTELRGA